MAIYQFRYVVESFCCFFISARNIFWFRQLTQIIRIQKLNFTRFISEKEAVNIVVGVSELYIEQKCHFFPIFVLIEWLDFLTTKIRFNEISSIMKINNFILVMTDSDYFFFILIQQSKLDCPFIFNSMFYVKL